LAEKRRVEASLRCTSIDPENNSPLNLNVVGKIDSTTLEASAEYDLTSVALASKLHLIEESKSLLEESKFSSFMASEFTTEDNFRGYEVSLSPPVCKRPFSR
jgi:hypothetical protein